MYLSSRLSWAIHFQPMVVFHLPYTLSLFTERKKNYAQRETTKTVTKKNIPPFYYKNFPFVHRIISSMMLRAHCKRTYTHTFMFVNKRIFPIAAWLLLLPIVWRLQLKIPTFVHFSIAIVIGRLLTTTTTTLNFFQCMLCIRIIFWQWETPRYISFFDAQKHSWLLVYFRVTLCEVGYFVSCNNIFNLWVLKVRIFIIWHFQVSLSVNFRIA